MLLLGKDMQTPKGAGLGEGTCCRTPPEGRVPLPYGEVVEGDVEGPGVVDGALEVEGGADEVRAGTVVGGGAGRWKTTLPLGSSTAM